MTRREDVRGGSHRGDTAAGEQDDVVGEARREAQVVKRHDDGAAFRREPRAEFEQCQRVRWLF